MTIIDANRTAVLHIAERARVAVRPERKFRRALASRDVINQAKGILVERYGVTADAASALLQRLSESSGATLDHVSRQLVDKRGLMPRTPAPGANLELRRVTVREATRC